MTDDEADKYSNKVPAFLRVYRKEVTLKFVFDNLRNYGISAVLFYSGVVLFKHGTTGWLLSVPYGAKTAGIVVMLMAFLLAVFNFYQGCTAMYVVRTWRMVTYMAAIFITYAVLFEVFFQRALNGGQ